MKKTKILFVMLQLDAGGSERVVLYLAKGLDPKVFDVFVVAFKGGVLYDQMKSICNKLFIIEKKRGLDFLAILRLAMLIKKFRIDVVNAHHYMPCFYSFFATRILNGKRLIYTEHSVPEVEGIANSFHGRILHWMLYRITAVVGVSRAITEKFKEKFPRHADKFHPILNGVDIESFSKKESRENIRMRWGLSKDHFVVGTVANFRKVKNHACLVRAASRLKESHPQLRLFFVGAGFPGDSENSEDDVRTMIYDLGLQNRIIMSGYQDNIPEILSAFDSFCLPSFSEGLPVSLLEAMAARIPVIGSDVKGIVEVVEHKKTGLLFSSDDDEALSRRLKSVMTNPAFSEILTEQALDFVFKNHDKNTITRVYSTLFQNH